MYTLLAGKHPMHVASDTKASYFAKLSHLDFDFPETFSEYPYVTIISRLAKNFFSHLCCPEVDRRYTASTALSHPWITRYPDAVATVRNFSDEIPVSLFEERVTAQNRADLLSAVRATLFLAVSNPVGIAREAQRAKRGRVKAMRRLFGLDRPVTLDESGSVVLLSLLSRPNSRFDNRISVLSQV